MTDTELLIGAGIGIAGVFLIMDHRPLMGGPSPYAGKTPYQNPNAQNISAAKGNATAQDLSAGAATIGALGNAIASVARAVQLPTGGSSPNDYTRNSGIQPTGYPLGSGSQDPGTFESTYQPNVAIDYGNSGSGGDEEQNA